MVGSLGVALAMAVIMIIAGFLFSSVSGYMAGLVGSSNNPVSGITICTILFASLVLMWMVGGKSAIGAVAVVFIGAVVCNAAAVAGDNLQDLEGGPADRRHALAPTSHAGRRRAGERSGHGAGA